MSDYFEIDLLDVSSPKSGDAIAIRYQIGDRFWVHAVDGGFKDSGAILGNFIRTRYNTNLINNVIVTHNDTDHASGLTALLEDYEVEALWMLRPWVYATELIPHFPTYSSVERLTSRLRSIYPNLAALEDIALKKQIPIFEPFQGASIGPFRILSPSRERFLQLVLRSEKTPEVEPSIMNHIDTLLGQYMPDIVNLVRRGWGYEAFSAQETSAENEMSVIQYADLCNKSILLTGDAGRISLTDAGIYARSRGIQLPGIDFFQVPHHGSRRNLSTLLLDYWLGPRLDAPLPEHQKTCWAMISSSVPDTAHPRKAVLRAMEHRGRLIGMTEGGNKWFHSNNAPARPDYSPITPVPYPDEIEE